MQEQLSQEPSPSLSEAVSEIRSSIQTLNNPKKVFILSQQFITDTIKDHLHREGILNCSLICWYLEHQKYPPLIFKKLLDFQNEQYQQVISFWLSAYLNRINKNYDWSDISSIMLEFIDFQYCLNNNMFSKKKENIKPGRKLVPSEDSPSISSPHKPRQPLSRFVSSLRRMISENRDSNI